MSFRCMGAFTLKSPASSITKYFSDSEMCKSVSQMRLLVPFQSNLT